MNQDYAKDEEMLHLVEKMSESNPMMGLRGCRLGLTFADETYLETRLNYGGKTEFKSNGYIKNGIVFTTTGETTVTIYWVQGGDDHRQVALYDLEGNIVVQSDDQTSAKNDPVITTFTVPAGTYVLGNVVNTNYHFKVVVEVASPIEVGTGYKVTADNANGALWLKGTITSGRFDCVTNEADAAVVYVEETTGGYLLYMNVDGTKTYINMADKAAGGSTTTDATAATVYEWNYELNTLVVADDTNNRAFGSGATSTYTNFSAYDISGDYNWGQFVAVDAE